MPPKPQHLRSPLTGVSRGAPAAPPAHAVQARALRPALAGATLGLGLPPAPSEAGALCARTPPACSSWGSAGISRDLPSGSGGLNMLSPCSHYGFSLYFSL